MSEKAQIGKTFNILRLVYEYPTPWDGLTPGPFEISRAQAKLGNKVVMFCGGWPQYKKYPEPLLRVYRFPRALKRFSLFLTTAPCVFLAFFVYRMRNRVDLVHGHGHLPIAIHIYKKLFGRFDRFPYFFHLHVTAAGREENILKSGKRLSFWTKYFEWPLHKFSDRLGCQVANAVFVTSESVKQESLKFYGADSQKLFIVENGVNTDLFSPGGPTERENLGLEENDRIILYIGAISERKNIHLLVESLRFLPVNYKLLIVGGGDPSYRRRLEGLMKEWAVENRVIFAGYVEYPRISSFYRTAGVFLLPSQYEGFPKVVPEALACGTPVLASGFKMTEKIRGLHFLEKLNPKDLAIKIREVVESGEKVDVNFICQNYDWSVKASEIQSVYQKII